MAHDESIKISIIIVSYNVREFLEQALLSLQKSLKNISNEIYVVDNASSDGTVSFLKRRFRDVSFIENSENIGFARANNQALARVRGEYICLINPDTIVQENTFSVLLQFFQDHPDAGMLGCKILNADGSLQLACRRSVPTPWVAFTKVIGLARLFPKSRLFGQYNLTYLDPEQVAQVEAISGSFMFLKRAVLEAVGGLDEQFFMYGEDLDWCYRIRRAGYPIYYVPDTQIIHFKGESSKKSPFQQRRLFYEAMRLFVRKHFKKGRALIPSWFLLLAIHVSAGLAYVSEIVRRLVWPLVDVLVLTCSLAAAVYVRFRSEFPWQPFVLVHIVYTMIWIICLAAFGVYKQHRLSGSKAASGIVMGLLINSTFTFFFKQFAFSRAVVLLAGAMNLMLAPLWRFTLKWLARKGYGTLSAKLKNLLLRRRSLVVGDRETAGKIIEKMRSHVDGSYLIEGVVLLRADEAEDFVNDVPVLGMIDFLPEIIRRQRVQEVIFSTDKLPYDKMLNAVANSLGSQISFKMAPSDLDVIIGKATIDYIDDIPFVDLDYRLHSPFYQSLKRLFDIMLAILVLCVTIPIRLVIGACQRPEKVTIRLPLAEKSVVHTRIFSRASIRFWWFLPALPSIIKGDLSFVGRDMFYTPTQDQVGYSLQPGLTGLEHVNRGAGLTDEDRKRYHLYYLKNYSPFLDIEILVKTMLKRRF
ncbi:glycosyltransferase [candidate division KSB1 bacterium]|nr:glycosyltransferase [candidate division KSB1 bacterium]RQW09464.1 MAG: glycosyltransferase [candidate division KSB1 bacterium]